MVVVDSEVVAEDAVVVDSSEELAKATIAVIQMAMMTVKTTKMKDKIQTNDQ